MQVFVIGNLTSAGPSVRNTEHFRYLSSMTSMFKHKWLYSWFRVPGWAEVWSRCSAVMLRTPQSRRRQMHSSETMPLCNLDNELSQSLFDNPVPNHSHKRNTLGVGQDVRSPADPENTLRPRTRTSHTGSRSPFSVFGLSAARVAHKHS